MGEPDTTRPCGKNLWWGGDGNYFGHNDGTCVSEDRYEYFLSAWGVDTLQMDVQFRRTTTSLSEARPVVITHYRSFLGLTIGSSDRGAAASMGQGEGR